MDTNPGGFENFNLDRFVQAQAPVYDRVLEEVRAGRKRSHWMWFIFPQLARLGSSPTARQYAIASVAEAQMYLAHPLLGTRFRECVAILLRLSESDPHRIFGSPDDMKFRSSLTLFREAGEHELAANALVRFFGGEADKRTLELLSKRG